MRFFSLLLALILTPFAAFAQSQPPSVDASAVVLIEADGGRMLYGENENTPLPVASTTKIMTALLTLENCGLDETVKASENASGVPGTSIYLGVGETLKVEELLYALMLRSGNDAAVALAEHISRDAETFAELMNREAERLGADAHFVNPHGLDANGHAASAMAMAIITREAMDYPVFRKLVSTKSKVIPWEGNQYDRQLTNKNKLLTDYPQATGVKTGFTKKAGRCLVFAAKRDGMELIGVLLNCSDWFNEAKKLLDWGFDEYRLEPLLIMGEKVGEIMVENGIEGRVNAVAPRPLIATLAKDESAHIEIELEEKLTAPVKAGTVVGIAKALVGNEVVSSQVLVAEKGTERRTFLDALFKAFSRFNPVA